MPSRRVHNLVNKMILGDDYDWLNKLIDSPSKWLGPYHRVLFHDEKRDPLITLLLTGDPGAAAAHLLHILVDKDKRARERLLALALLLGDADD